MTDRATWRRAFLTYAPVLVLAAGAPAPAASAPTGCEQFDVSGLPATPTTFLEQQIRSLIENHRPGDDRDAVFIQRKLARAYREKGDLDRAHMADQAAGSAGASGGPAAALPAATPAAGPGRFRLQGNTLVLDVQSAAGGYVTPGLATRSSLLGASRDATSETRSLRLEKVGSAASGGIVLGGVRLKPKSW